MPLFSSCCRAWCWACLNTVHAESFCRCVPTPLAAAKGHKLLLQVTYPLIIFLFSSSSSDLHPLSRSADTLGGLLIIQKFWTTHQCACVIKLSFAHAVNWNMLWLHAQMPSSVLCPANSAYPEYFSLAVHLLMCQTKCSLCISMLSDVWLSQSSLLDWNHQQYLKCFFLPDSEEEIEVQIFRGKGSVVVCSFLSLHQTASISSSVLRSRGRLLYCRGFNAST